MKILVAYDSQFGNTGKIAQAIGDGLGAGADVSVTHVGDVTPGQLASLDLLIVGCPTQRFTATGATTRFLKSIPANGLAGINVAAFDTRFKEAEIEKIRILAFFVRIFGYAAGPIAGRLQKKGGTLIAPPEAFYVDGTEGPLLEGELERAAGWARQII